MPENGRGDIRRMAKGNLINTARELVEQSAEILAKATRARRDADAMFDECIQLGVLTDKMKLQIARHMDRMDEGIKRWRNATDRRQSNFMSQTGGRSAQA